MSNDESFRESFKTAKINLLKAIAELVDLSVDRSLRKRVREAEVPVEEGEPVEKKVEGPVACDGNVESGTPCPLEEAERKKSAATKHNGKLHPTCKLCKKAIAKLRAEQRKAAAPLEEVKEVAE